MMVVFKVIIPVNKLPSSGRNTMYRKMTSVCDDPIEKYIKN